MSVETDDISFHNVYFNNSCVTAWSNCISGSNSLTAQRQTCTYSNHCLLFTQIMQLFQQHYNFLSIISAMASVHSWPLNWEMMLNLILHVWNHLLIYGKLLVLVIWQRDFSKIYNEIHTVHMIWITLALITHFWFTHFVSRRWWYRPNKSRLC